MESHNSDIYYSDTNKLSGCITLEGVLYNLAEPYLVDPHLVAIVS